MDICFDSILETISKQTLIRIPEDVDKALPTRGMLMLEGTLNSVDFQSPAEPDGTFSHWLTVSPAYMEQHNLSIGQTVHCELAPMKDWPEPEIPEDIMKGIVNGAVLDQWESLTVKARWEWLRSIRSTNSPETRAKRIEVACDKLRKGSRRPCCFDTSRCTVMEVSQSGILKSRKDYNYE